MFTIVTSRFNNETRDANYAYRAKHNFACMYCCPSELSNKIPYNTFVFVIEMNNSTNKIEGIGLIKNSYETNRYYKVHTNGNTNRYTYIGKHFIEREMINEYNSKIVIILEEILFKGKTHSKRGTGLTSIPKRFLDVNRIDDLCEGIDIKREIKELFIYHYKDKSGR